MPSTFPVPCRLSIILARQAPIGVIFRRGPSKWTQIIKWNTNADTFEAGAWFHGQIYPERSDLSPDGTKLIYFAADYSAGSINHDFPNPWTAISKIPWLTALSVWPNGNTYYGGGRFETDTQLWINQNFWYQGEVTVSSTLPQDFEVDCEHPTQDHKWHELSRWESSGWNAVQAYPWGSIPLLRRQPDNTVSVEPTDPSCPLHTPAYIRTVHEKTNANGSCSLIMTSIYAHYQENTRTFQIRDNHQKTAVTIESVDWADWDKRERLVCAKAGKIFTLDSLYSGELRFIEVADFNAAKPRRTKAPDWARKW